MSTRAGRESSGESNSTTLSEGITRAMKYTTLTEPTIAALPEESENPEESEEYKSTHERLKRALSTKSVISTTSSFATRMQRAASQLGLEQQPVRSIGLGSCGSVFEIPGTQLAFKKGGIAPDIFRDFSLTNKVHYAVRDTRTIMQEAFPGSTLPKTPFCHEYHPADDEAFWSRNIRRFPKRYRTKQPLFVVDRILPLPKETREDLITLYFADDEKIQQKAKNNPENKDCLLRIYLGECESDQQQENFYDTLRNFPMRLNMIEDLEIDFSQLAKEMAIGLATMHWQAQVDGMDVEFVIGSSATWDGEQPKGYDESGEGINFERRSFHLWMFDFDKAREIELTKHDVDTRMVPAFLGNDPYYPRPQVDEDLWEEFVGFYLKASEVILRQKGVDEGARGLPQQFLDEVVRVTNETEGWNENDNIVFK